MEIAPRREDESGQVSSKVVRYNVYSREYFSTIVS